MKTTRKDRDDVPLALDGVPDFLPKPVVFALAAVEATGRQDDEDIGRFFDLLQ